MDSFGLIKSGRYELSICNFYLVSRCVFLLT